MGEATRAGERVEGFPHLEGQHSSIVLVDVEKYGDPARTVVDQLQVRHGMYSALEKACTGAGIPWKRCEVDDRGDGVMVLVPAEVSKNRLVTVLPELLAASLEEHNAECQPQARIRLRLALHAGEVHRDERGYTSNSLNFAFRLLDSAEARSTLASSPGTLVVIVSDYLYQNVIRQDPAAAPESYRSVWFTTKETSASAWIRLPSAPLPATLAGPTGQPLSHIEEDRLTTILRSTDSSGNREPALTVLVDRLLAIPTVAQEAGRRLVMDHLRPEMANAVPYFPQTRHHVFSLVRTCLNYPGGIEELLSAVRYLEGASSPVRLLNETVSELLSRTQD